jgi:hypothetical protein
MVPTVGVWKFVQRKVKHVLTDFYLKSRLFTGLVSSQWLIKYKEKLKLATKLIKTHEEIIIVTVIYFFQIYLGTAAAIKLFV